jgi:hypothetical protein
MFRKMTPNVSHLDIKDAYDEARGPVPLICIYPPFTICILERSRQRKQNPYKLSSKLVLRAEHDVFDSQV